jgi:fibronectin-binding autotransporter adhesin
MGVLRNSVKKVRYLLCKGLVMICLMFIGNSLSAQNLAITGNVDAVDLTVTGTINGGTFSGILGMGAIGSLTGLTSTGTIKAAGLTISGSIFGAALTTSGGLSVGTGATVGGGLSVTGQIYSTGISVAGTIYTSGITTSGSLGVLGNLYIGGSVNLSSINLGSGGLTTTGTIDVGGITVLGSIYAAGLTTAGNITVKGAILAQTVTGASYLQLRQTGDTYGESGVYILHRNGQNGAVFYTGNNVDLVDFGFLSQTTNSQFNIRFEHRGSSVTNATNTAGEFQLFNTTQSGAAVGGAFASFGPSAVSLSGSLSVVGSASSGGGLTVTGALVSLNSSSNFNTDINTGTSTGSITLGGTGTQTINIGAGASGVKTIGIGTSAAGNVVRFGTGRIITNRGAPTTGGTTTLTTTQILDVGYYILNANGTLTFPTAASLVAAATGVKVNDVIQFSIFPNGNFTPTLAAGTGVTIAQATGTARVSRVCYIQFTNVTGGAEAYTVY